MERVLDVFTLIFNFALLIMFVRFLLQEYRGK